MEHRPGTSALSVGAIDGSTKARAVLYQGADGNMISSPRVDTKKALPIVGAGLRMKDSDVQYVVCRNSEKAICK
jgi:hypothetical protein